MKTKPRRRSPAISTSKGDHRRQASHRPSGPSARAPEPTTTTTDARFPDDWKLKITIEEDEDAWPVAERFLVWIAPAADGHRVQHHLCIGSGATRDVAILDALTELNGAVTLLAKAEGR